MFRSSPAASPVGGAAGSTSTSHVGVTGVTGSGGLPGPTPLPASADTVTGTQSSGSRESTTESMWRKMVADNPYFGAGAGLMAIGVVLTATRRATTLGASFAQRRMLVTLEIPSKDRSYPWFLEWMAHQTPSPYPSSSSSSSQPPARGLRSLLSGSSPMSLRSHELAVETTYKAHENGSSEAVFNLVPGPGTHYFRYRGSWFQVKRERDAKLMDLHSGSPWETLTLTTLSSSRHLFAQLLSEARRLAEQSTEGKTVVYTAWGVEWRPFGKPRRRREMGSVVLGEGVAERVERDLRGFLGRGKWYAERGIPYRRGYLLHGPPGSGKTSFIQALAGELGYNICLLNLAERGLTDDKLNHLLGLVPERSFVLLEDIDSAFSKREQTSEDGFKSNVTFSGLLNALDGVASSEERVIFMTTNHYDRLDPALIRPGRVDIHELLGDAAGEQAERLFVKFYGRGASDPARSSVPSTSFQNSKTDTGLSRRNDAGDVQAAGRGGQESETRGVHGLPVKEAELGDEEIAKLGGEVNRTINEGLKGGKSISMAALQGLFIRHGPRNAVSALKELV